MGGTIRRRLGFDTNPLRRGTDRIQTVARMLAALVFLAACVGGVVTGLASYQQLRGIERLDDTFGYRAKGHVLTSKAMDVGQNGPTGIAHRIAWQDREGQRHVQRFDTSPLRALPDSVTLYIDADGKASLSPGTHPKLVARAVFDGIVTVVYVLLGLAVAYSAFLLQLNRRRKSVWAKEWAVVEPRWRRQVL